MAIDLSWDIIARFTSFNMPNAFYDDFVKVAEDEARVRYTISFLSNSYDISIHSYIFVYITLHSAL